MRRLVLTGPAKTKLLRNTAQAAADWLFGLLALPLVPPRPAEWFLLGVVR